MDYYSTYVERYIIIKYLFESPDDLYSTFPAQLCILGSPEGVCDYGEVELESIIMVRFWFFEGTNPFNKPIESISQILSCILVMIFIYSRNRCAARLQPS